ncbi:MAG: hypothetical protein O2960_18925, partial [Verrucomicrobia bacterium]|nr:hypothetical protein [Verrucomicrobiota bacterium]
TPSQTQLTPSQTQLTPSQTQLTPISDSGVLGQVDKEISASVESRPLNAESASNTSLQWATFEAEGPTRRFATETGTPIAIAGETENSASRLAKLNPTASTEQAKGFIGSNREQSDADGVVLKSSRAAENESPGTTRVGGVVESNENSDTPPRLTRDPMRQSGFSVNETSADPIDLESQNADGKRADMAISSNAVGKNASQVQIKGDDQVNSESHKVSSPGRESESEKANRNRSHEAASSKTFVSNVSVNATSLATTSLVGPATNSPTEAAESLSNFIESKQDQVGLDASTGRDFNSGAKATKIVSAAVSERSEAIQKDGRLESVRIVNQKSIESTEAKVESPISESPKTQQPNIARRSDSVFDDGKSVSNLKRPENQSAQSLKTYREQPKLSIVEPGSKALAAEPIDSKILLSQTGERSANAVSLPLNEVNGKSNVAEKAVPQSTGPARIDRAEVTGFGAGEKTLSARIQSGQQPIVQSGESASSGGLDEFLPPELFEVARPSKSALTETRVEVRSSASQGSLGGGGALPAEGKESAPGFGEKKDTGSKNSDGFQRGTVDAQLDDDMAHTATSESYSRAFGKNIPESAKNDIPLGTGRRGLSGFEPSVNVNGRMADSAGLTGAQTGTQVQNASGSRFESVIESSGAAPSRLSDQVWSAVESFRAQGARDWTVRIRPDHDTELNLRMRLQGNQLVVHAQLEAGRHELISSRWNELQFILADRGVQLQPLESGAGNGQPHNQNQHGSSQFGSNGFERRESFEQQQADAEFISRAASVPSNQVLEAVKTSNEKTKVSQNRLETWA